MNSTAKMDVSHMDLFYGDFQALTDINIAFEEHRVTAMIGPSGCGKSTLLKSLNRMNDLVEGCKISGSITLDGQDIYNGYDVNVLRKKVGMVFQKANPFPMSIYDNIAFGPRTHGIKKKAELDEIVEDSLRKAAIFDELKDRLKKNALGLSGGQQQRLCIARALAVNFQDRGAGRGAEEQLHHHYCYPQHAAGGAYFRHNRLLPSGKDGGMRPYANHVLESTRQAYRRLHLREVRLIWHDRFSTKSSTSCNPTS